MAGSQIEIAAGGLTPGALSVWLEGDCAWLGTEARATTSRNRARARIAASRDLGPVPGEYEYGVSMPSVQKKQINVVGAVIVRDGQILCAQRGKGALAGMWEFPGGKIEPGETPRAALEREITEELMISVAVGDQVASTTHEYDFGVVTLTTFYCALTAGTPQLTEHAAVEWRTPATMDELAWAPADIPAVMVIRAGLNIDGD